MSSDKKGGKLKVLKKNKKKEVSERNRLDLVESVFHLQGEQNLQNVILIGAQHLLPSTFNMLQSFFDRGLSPKNVFLIGKCYSTDLETYSRLKDLGVFVCPSSKQFDKSVSFDSFYASNVRSFSKKLFKLLLQNPKMQIILLDDGGDLISCFNSFAIEERFNISSLEQTSSGYEKIKKLDLHFGVVNVARSFAKLSTESKIVARTAIYALYEELLRLSTFPKKVLIFGNGVIGSALSDAFEGRFDVSLADIIPEKSEKPYKYYLQHLHDYDLIIGCVGRPVLSEDMIKKLKPGTILASLSSSDREFDIVRYRKKLGNLNSCHCDFKCPNGVNVLNCGFPINFCSNAQHVDIKEFELTRALLSLGILQALDSFSKKGFIDLDKIRQNELLKLFFSKYHSKREYDSNFFRTKI